MGQDSARIWQKITKYKKTRIKKIESAAELKRLWDLFTYTGWEIDPEKLNLDEVSWLSLSYPIASSTKRQRSVSFGAPHPENMSTEFCANYLRFFYF